MVGDDVGDGDLAVLFADENASVSHTDICAEQKITGYPTLNLYLDGSKIEEYSECSCA